MNIVVSLAKSDQETQNCFEVMFELRPHLKRDEFVSRVRRQQKDSGYELASVTDLSVKAVAVSVFLNASRGASFFMLTILSPGVAIGREVMVESCLIGLSRMLVTRAATSFIWIQECSALTHTGSI